MACVTWALCLCTPYFAGTAAYLSPQMILWLQ